MDLVASLQTLATGFFESFGVNYSGLEIQTMDAEKNIYTIKISSDDSPLLIGPHGKTLEEIQGLFIQMMENQTGTHCIIHLEINDYLAEKQKRLMGIVDRKVEMTKRNGIDQVMYDLSGYERKQVHAYISEAYPEVATKSADGARGRELHIFLKEGVKPTGEPITTIKSSVNSTAEDLESLDLEGTNI